MSAATSSRLLIVAATMLAPAIVMVAAPNVAEAAKRRWNATLTIYGTPPTTVAAGSTYAFAPVVRSSTTALSYSITNKPIWSNFSISTGALTGTPANANAGTYSNVVISVSDGTRTASLAPFSISVTSTTSGSTGGATSSIGTTTTTTTTTPSPAPTISLSPTTIDSGGYSTVIWRGTSPCTASATPAYSVWSGSKSADWSQSVAPTVSTIFAINCNGVSSSATLTVNGSAPPTGTTTTTTSTTTTSSTSGTTTSSGNVAPIVSGAPPAYATVGVPYSFTPVATDANSDPLTFRAQNLPSWAALNTSTGEVSGTPAASNVGSYGGIVLTVSDGQLSSSLNSFSITVASATTSTTGAYAGYTYNLPTVRPFISLNNFAGKSLTSPAVTRLRSQVDDAVTVTAGVPAGATYDQLVSALNSGHYGYSSADSVVMYRLTGDTRYIDQAIRMVDLFVTSENARIASGQVPVIAGDSYLEVGFYMEQVALAYDYGYARLTPAQRAAWTAFAEQTIWNVWNYSNAQWGGVSRPWTGWSVSDPGNNYFYSFLKATQLWALASQNQTWFNYLQANKYTLVTPFFYKLTGGGSREGTGYGTALGSLFEDYSYWKDSTGEDLSAYSTHARDTIDYWIHATVPTMNYFGSIGDQSRSSMPIMFDYQRKLVAEAVALNPASAQGQRGTWWLNRVRVTDGGSGYLTGMMRYNYDFRYDLLTQSAAEAAPTATAYNAAGTGVLFARSDWSTTASWMHTIAGPFDQSHAHQDQGGFSFYKSGWLTVTSNVYSDSGINQDTGVENVIRFMSNGTAIGQGYSTSSKTYTDDGNTLVISETLTPAYAGSGGRVSSWLRQLAYQRSSHSLTVHDYCSVASGVTPVWQLHVPVAPVRQSDGSFLAGALRITPLSPAAPTVAIVDMRAVSGDFNGGYRLELTGPAGSCEFNVTLQAQ